MATSRGRGPGARAAHRVQGEPAYVLHRYDWSESSLILDLFTRDHGRVAVVAKGAKRPYSQLRPVLLPFQRLVVGYSSREEEGGEVHTLKSAEWAGGSAMLTGAPLLTGFYLNELLMKLLARADPHPVLFDVYARTLPYLSAADDLRVQAALRAFELLLLRELGVLPQLDLATLTHTPVQPEARYLLHGEAGVVEADRPEGALSGRTLLALQRALEADGLEPLQAACATALPELRTALRALLHYHVGTPQLRTRQMMMDVQRLLDRNQPPAR
ncbi:DNA repair protein RecO [Caldimonas thermodepolymerans]|jgi:DNA repair protein RecO|uniref:DNA repair protein RecO n=1 Tax=Caldimonas thermodepolymerans TaxID=215580 RepID=A0A2S5T8I6_9BURK|nr:DNA repair protein RecO [Caldimonas thermodepolymerans]PPE71293.1 DNA repair protein RecO [Caldimonas thermodepolymerans]QPC32466.1 DNA repair protein RecO [Caldimonas thermodepolymerans]RDH98855.1 DNA replication and repair protein RecO [Caldimonas thermodepolymerans]TCP06253.1 DNA replication and repair protein RecO [Caldimonas thermodepolymerans]UZG49016.1 DNA repair protein RecO [Caldimonas thermodepolymerans]